MDFKLPNLPYSYDDLSPYMSKETLEYHHDVHHKNYADNALKLASDAEMLHLSLEEIIIKSHGSNAGLFNNASQYYNHNLFWACMKKNDGKGKVPQALSDAIDDNFGSFEKFKSDLITAASTQFGSGWGWLSVKNGKLEISKTQNAENPLINGAIPILGIDVWEHAYYLDFKYRRAHYIESFITNLVNWEYVCERYETAMLAQKVT
ncbi:superoxide dismutase [Candidatus Liberibacter asiaticus]|uniref:Superoxide dismutase n=2 Tax=Liberibacter asiaticus TaxID=34021 RepID=C6XF16_LIBAP|nr:superoxide dismutase [Candidatus Liberibacter asiaticus]ACT56968.1 superoxide dismutase [Candidatus Liberibacter asiaticus str. psy62]AGH17066.1 superoxide dismutase [Candidatus Liberibacter asiaticus str. gxpsy]ALK07390.1 superoxide dismutase [Candidatus Liberibacter asiaticus]ASK52881.1 superoxide dismutase [Candidatus Liberibacter asiaticus]AWL14199.1 superoxide dismutase [Candidatus Liberibacter asiaticus]